MKRILFLGIFTLQSFAMPHHLWAYDWSFDVPGVGRVGACDTCGGGVFGGVAIGPVNPLDPFGTVQQVAKAVGDTLLSQAVQNLEQFKNNLTSELQVAVANAINNGDKAISDAAMNLTKSTNDIVDAAHAAARYAEREVGSYHEVLSKAERRVREGKVADAIWHYSTDSWQETSKNAAQAAQESEIIVVPVKQLLLRMGGRQAPLRMQPGLHTIKVAATSSFP